MRSGLHCGNWDFQTNCPSISKPSMNFMVVWHYEFSAAFKKSVYVLRRFVHALLSDSLRLRCSGMPLLLG